MFKNNTGKEEVTAKLFNAIMKELHEEEISAKLNADLRELLTAPHLKLDSVDKLEESISKRDKLLKSCNAELTAIEQSAGWPEGTINSIKGVLKDTISVYGEAGATERVNKILSARAK
jgi:hypothetical protein